MSADTVQCWFGDGPATAEYWFEPRQEWRPLCIAHEANAVSNLPAHYVREIAAPFSDNPGGET